MHLLYMKKKAAWKWFKILWFSLVTIFMIWNWSTFQSRGVDDDVLLSTPNVEVVINDDLLSFYSQQVEMRPEVLFFPRGLVDPLAYAPLARELAENGYTTHIVKMPWRLAQRGYTKITTLFNLDDPDKVFVLGGHSQGAKIAAQFACENPYRIDGIFLLGTSHPRDIDLSSLDLPTLKLYAEHDGLASMGEVLENKPLLPNNTELVLIEGGNHSQFGNMGSLLMDERASIGRRQQQSQTLAHMLNFLNKLAVSGL